MVKLSSSDILQILRKFEVAGDDNVPRHISMVSFTSPHPKNTLVHFRFAHQEFYILIDSEADDDTEYILEQIRSENPDTSGEVYINPTDHITTYGMPFKGKDVYLFGVKSTKTRLDQELVKRYPDTSRSVWQKYIKSGYVRVNGNLNESPKYEVSPSDDIAVSIPQATDYSEQELPVVYIDDNVIVINKPIGVLSHSKGALNDEFTVADFFARYTSYNTDSNRPGIVHRLDRDTSGIMIGARNEETAKLLQKQFADRKTKKTYIAIVDGVPKARKAYVDLPIGRNPSSPSTFRVDPKGKSAVTKYEVLAENEKNAAIKLEPRTGRTHQLRVHMNYLKTPIKGDKVYGTASDRLYLHALSLEITIPLSERRTFTAPLPIEFTNIFPELI